MKNGIKKKPKTVPKIRDLTVQAGCQVFLADF